MNSQTSNSDQGQNSTAYFLLTEKVRRWIWEQGWTELRDVQEQAIEPILACNTDLLISASTASGKTEAAFLPICSKLADDEALSVRTLYISPLKALINDQYDRLLALCEHLNIPVFKWHGDVSSSTKRRFLNHPAGILQITPESLEALFMLHGSAIKPMLSNLNYVIIDELHSFIGTERGRQLQSLLHRIETVLNRRVPRIGLSATLGDMRLAAEFLRPNSDFPCQQLEAAKGGQELRLQIRGYLWASPPQSPAISNESSPDEAQDDMAVNAIAQHLFATLRGSTNLVFTNSRSLTELYSAKLRALCEDQLLPVEFWPHHGSLSKTFREETETALKDKSQPATAICTTTLEMGIDIGSVKSIAQIGTPPAVASLRQRLGRSGRRGEPSILRVYIQEFQISPESPPQDLLRVELFQAIAMVNLLLNGWCEPPLAGQYHFSTLVQQILSMICQYGAIDALRTWRVLCETGPFSNVSSSMFATLLRSMGACNLVSQAADGTLMLGWQGEKLVNNYDFYSAFTSPKEYTLFAEEMTLGTMPMLFPPIPDTYLIFAGRRWRITEVDADRMSIFLIPAKTGKPPKFFGAGAFVFDEIRKEMFQIYAARKMPNYLDPTAIQLFTEGIDFFDRTKLAQKRLLSWNKDTIIFPWCGDRAICTLYLLLRQKNLDVQNDGTSLTVRNASEGSVRDTLVSILEHNALDPISLVSGISDKQAEKHDCFVDKVLLNQEFAAKNIDIQAAYDTIHELIS